MGERVTFFSSSPRFSVSFTGLPPEASTACVTCVAVETGCPSTAQMRSPSRRPAFFGSSAEKSTTATPSVCKDRPMVLPPGMRMLAACTGHNTKISSSAARPIR